MRRVFVVEDDEQQRSLIVRFLSLEGFHVHALGGPIGATNEARRFRPDVVLVDLDLPAYDGAHVIRLLREHGVQAEYFVWSASSPAQIEAAAKGCEAGWFSKSMPLAHIAETLRGTS